MTRSRTARRLRLLVVLGSVAGGLAALRQRKLAENARLYGLPS